ncbi:MAG: hypothetical protein N3B10_08610, partial [Armatimonadetes bacterium]|nr:hypothetical protein [Armatimonadota bacterium]
MDFLRLLPFSSHSLFIARSFPAFAFRLYVTTLWLPLYLAPFIIFGISTASAFCFAAIIGLSSPNAILLFAMCLNPNLMQFYGWQSNFLLAVLMVAILPLRVSDSFKFLMKIDIFVILFLFGSILLSKWFPDPEFSIDKWLPFYSGSLPLLQGMALLLFASGIAHFDRTARWLESPKGMKRLVFVLPIAIVLFVTQGILWGYLKQELKWQLLDCFILCSIANFVLSGLLFWLWQNWSWAEKSVPTKEPSDLLTETFALRIVTALMPFVGYWLSGISSAQLDFNFVNFWLLLNFVDAFNLAVSRGISLKVLACWRISGVIWLAFVGAFPYLGLLSEKFSWLAAISPSASLLGLAIGLVEGKAVLLTVPLLKWQLAVHPVSL